MTSSIHTHSLSTEIEYCHGYVDILLNPRTTGYGTFHQGNLLRIVSFLSTVTTLQYHWSLRNNRALYRCYVLYPLDRGWHKQHRTAAAYAERSLRGGLAVILLLTNQYPEVVQVSDYQC